MQVEEALKILDVLLPPGSLNTVKTLVFREAWDNKKYGAIAESAGYDANYIKTVAAQLWKALSQVLGEKVTKKNFRSILRQKFWAPESNSPQIAHQAYPNVSFQAAAVSAPVPPSAPAPQHSEQGLLLKQNQLAVRESRCDWSAAPDISTFFGRAEEAQQLQQWILSGDCRLVAVLGMGGIGKTSFAIKVAHDLRGKVDYIFWRSLRNAPPLDHLLGDMVAFLTDQSVMDGAVDMLMQRLRSHRCLLILDNVETLLQSGLTGRYRPGYEGYGELFQVLGETPHQSCLLLTSREKPPEVAALEGMALNVKTQPLQGSLEVALPLIQTKRLVGSSADQQKLCEQYSCSPLALKMVTTSIQELCNGQITEFLQTGITNFNGIRQILDQQWQRLSPQEQTILRWLAVNRTWTSVVELHQDIVPAISRGQLLEALEALTWRSLIEQYGSRYYLQPVVLEYVTDKLISEIFQELVSNEIDSAVSPLSQYALLKATTPDYIRTTQTRLILAPIAGLLQRTLSTPTRLKEHLQALLNHFQQNAPMGLRPNRTSEHHADEDLPAGERSPANSSVRNGGYGAGNILNLAIQLGLDLTDFDCSHLTVRQADLRKAQLHRVNFAHTHFSETRFKQNFGVITTLAYSPNGDFIATAGTNGQIWIWRTADHQLHQCLQGSQVWICSLAYSPDGRYLASAELIPCLKIWDVTTGQCFKVLHLPESFHINVTVAFSPDGKTLAIGSSHPDILLYDLTTEQMQMLTGHQQSITAVTFSPDQRFLASSSQDHTVRLWEMATGNSIQVWHAHRATVHTVDFSPDGTWLASGGDDCTARCWHIQTGRCLALLQGHQAAIRTVCISPDGRTCITGSEDSTIRHWHMSDGQCLKKLQGHGGAIWEIALSPDGNTLVSSSLDRQIRIWALNSGHRLQTSMGYADYTHGLAFSPDGKTLAAGSSTSQVRLWDWAGETCTQTLQGHLNWVWTTTWHPSGQFLASAGVDHFVKVWHVPSGNCVATLTGYKNSLMDMAWHPNGHWLATTAQDNTIRLWDWRTGRCQQLMTIPNGWSWGVCWAPAGNYLASGSTDHVIRLWNYKTGNISKYLIGHQGGVTTILWTPDGRFLVSASYDGTVKIWDVAQGQCLHTLRHDTGQVFVVTFSADGQYLASGGSDAKIYLWDSATWERIQTITSHEAEIFGLSFHPTLPILASSSHDETICLWDIANNTRLIRLKGKRPYEEANITGVTGLSDFEKASLLTLGAIVQP